MRRAGAVVLRGGIAFSEEEVGTGMDRSHPNSPIDRFFELLTFPLLCPSVLVFEGVDIDAAKVDSTREVGRVAGVSMLFVSSVIAF
jgi:hypothetical protein